MKKKSQKKFVPAERVKQTGTQKNNQPSRDPLPVSSSHNKVEKREPAGKKPQRSWYRKPAFIIVFAFVLVAIIAGVGGYIAGHTGNNQPSNTQNGTAQAAPGTTPQTAAKIVISDVAVTDIGTNFITVKWKTNIPCNGEAHATYTDRELTISSFPGEITSNHEAQISGLASSGTYKIDVVCKDSKGNKEIVTLDKLYQTPARKTAMDIGAGDSAPDFSLADTTGKIKTLAEYKGKWVLLVFWDISCKSCKEELPYVNSYFNGISDPDRALLTISSKGQSAMVESYVKSQNLSMPVLLDGDGAVSTAYTVISYPTTILIDPGGKIAKIKMEAFKNSQEIALFVQDGMKGK